MRTRIYVYVDGVMTPAWRDHGEGYARTDRHRGELVVGLPNTDAVTNHRRAVERYKKKAKA